MTKKYYIIIIVCLILFDIITKYLVATNFNIGESLIVIDGLLNFTYVHNKGMAFSLLAEFEYSRYLLPSVSFIAIVVLTYLIKTDNNNIKVLAYSLILAGAFGNFIDRAFLGYVIDFIHFYYKDYNFSIFNIADSLITIGAILFLFSRNEQKD